MLRVLPAYLTALAIGLAPPCADGPGSPACAVAAAAADLAKQPIARRPYLRYLSLYNVPLKRRAEMVKVLAFQVNSLSRESELVAPVLVGTDLLRIDAENYGWELSVWERLGDIDPYFHTKVKFAEAAAEKRYWPGGKDTSGKDWPRKLYEIQRAKGETVSQHAPWLPTKDVLYLRKETYSEAPILRADWFLYQTAVQADRVAGYYDFLGLGKKQADFEELIGADRKKAEKVKREVAGVLARSGVTLQNRVVTRYGAITGGYWVTSDFKKSVDRQNVLRLLDKDLEPPQGDASEQYGVLPNGLFAFWLQNGQGVRQDTAPDFIASDGQASGTDRRVHIGLSCIRCHTEGIRPVNDYARRLYRGSIQLASADYKKFVRLRQLYLSDLQKWVRKDQADYAEALLSLTAMKPAELARAYARAWDDYAEADLLPADFARDLGVTEAQLLGALKAAAKAQGQIDPVLAGLIQDPPLEVRREHAEEVFSLAQTYLRGYLPKGVTK